MNREILFGVNPVFEALKAARRDIYKIYITKEKISKRLDPLIAVAESLKIPVERSNPLYLKSICGTHHHQGIGAETGPYPFVPISDLLAGMRKIRSTPLFLLLDHIMDPRNLGALIRTALCIDTDGVMIPKDRSAPPTPMVSRASAGALEHIRLCRVTNMVNTIRALKENNVWIGGMDKNSDQSIFDSELTGSLAIVIGGEEKGIRPLVKKHCDFLMSIPQTGPVDSLNASVAGAVAMYEAFRQRRYAK